MEVAVNAIKDITNKFDTPKCSVVPMVIVETPDAIGVLHVAAYDADEKKYIFECLLPSAIRDLKAKSIVHIAPGVAYTAKEAMEEKKPGSLYEVVTIIEMTADTCEGYISRVIRSANAPPMYTELTPIPKFQDLLLETVQVALQNVAHG